MPKAEKGTPKDIAKKIKAKGLQKLKFYCQMCEKQCRDANGFKCHLQSESHLRQMKIFSEHASGIMDRYSKEFEKAYLDTLRMRHGTVKVNANNVYQEVIQDKHHIHMNSTMWASLTDFVKYLGKKGKCNVEETERGWYIQYIDRDVSKIARDEALLLRQQAELEAELAFQERLEKQRIEAAQALDRSGFSIQNEPSQLKDLEATVDTKKIQSALQLAKKLSKKVPMAPIASSIFGESDDDEVADEEPASVENALSTPIAWQSQKSGTKRGGIEIGSQVQLNKKSRVDPDSLIKSKQEEEAWLYRGILVRIINKELADGRYFRSKAVVDRLVDEYTAEVTVLSDGESPDKGPESEAAVIRLDQDDLETVVPKKPEDEVRILKGPFRGKRAKVRALDKHSYLGVLELSDGTILHQMDYAAFAKLP